MDTLANSECLLVLRQTESLNRCGTWCNVQWKNSGPIRHSSRYDDSQFSTCRATPNLCCRWLINFGWSIQSMEENKAWWLSKPSTMSLFIFSSVVFGRPIALDPNSAKLWLAVRYRRLWRAVRYRRLWRAVRYRRLWRAVRYRRLWRAVRYRRLCLR